MKKLTFTLIACWTLIRLNAAEVEWMTDFNRAQAKAKSENKIVLMDFTGSDWCSWCMKFDKEVLSTDKFKEYASKNLVLVLVDFPNRKPQSDDLKKANEVLGKKYSVDGYPTFVVLNKDGKEIGRQLGYAEGGPEAFIEKLDKFKKHS